MTELAHAPSRPGAVASLPPDALGDAGEPPVDQAGAPVGRSFLREQLVLARLAWRFLSELSPRVLAKMLYLYAWKGARAIRAYRRRLRDGEIYPPFLFIAVTNTCNLRCHGCWVEKEGTAHFLEPGDIDRLITSGKRRQAHYYTLLGGEPYLFKGIWDVFARHPDCYFQTITNGMLFTEEHVARLRRLGNVTPLVSLDGFQAQNDLRRGAGVWEAAGEGMERLRRAGLFFGVATTATALNLREVMSDEYVRSFVERGALYLWYYVYRPMSPEPHTEYCLSEEQLVWMRRRLIELRRRHPILLIDTYWTASGEAFCPAATGLGFHIGPQGSVEICPALSFATDTIRGREDEREDLGEVFERSDFLRSFQRFVHERTKGCVILEHPQELHDLIRDCGARDYSGRGTAFAELQAMRPRRSHHLPGREIPEDFWFYRLLKRNVFFGMGAAG